LLQVPLTQCLPLAVATRPGRLRRALPARRQGRHGGLPSGWRLGTGYKWAWRSLPWKWMRCSTLTWG